MSDLRKIIIDGQEVEVHPDLALIQACEQAGIAVPRFCYHDRLSIAGNCRMCLVEVVGGPPKPAASCHMQVKDLRGGRNGELPEIKTNSPMVKKAREGVMEFLLINHPLDCPICDQGGECDLQDQALAFGRDCSRFEEDKRSMDEINLGPLIKTQMTRCIQCTRCVRYMTEVAGVPEMGCTGRGEDAEIISYLDRNLSSEMQGNVIDLCPVGALTSRPYAFTARPWELKKTESIDVMDALGANIRIDVRGREVMRIMPRNNDDVNEEWISDKTRFIWDGLRNQRLDRPYVRGTDGKLAPASWEQAFTAIADKMAGLSGGQIAAIAGDLVSVEAMWALKQLLAQKGVESLECRQDGALIPTDNPSAALFNPSIAGIDEADAILLIGTNPRLESPVLNARIRKAWLNGAEVGLIGQPVDLTYEYAHVGAGPRSLADFDQSGFYSVLKNAKRPMVVLGNGVLARRDGLAILGTAMQLAEHVGAIQEDWTGFGVLHTAASRIGGLEIGFVPGENGRALPSILDGAATGAVEMVWLLGADEIDMNRLGGAFVVYQGSHGDAGAHRADVILPGATYTEEPGIFVNLEGRPQQAMSAGLAPGEAKENWAIIRALSAHLGATLPFNSLAELRAQLANEHPRLWDEMDMPARAAWQPLVAGAMDDTPFAPTIQDFYLTNPIARASQVMAQLSKDAAERAAVAAE
ncbi:MAG: NADH-quinone oxidoreductase subunit NuoG [Neomegalonema sp.]|nr:NADH-quinone oxidoreductase subunit NuoG [Neomegalonema sp.]